MPVGHLVAKHKRIGRCLRAANRKEVDYSLRLDRSQWVKRSEVIYTLYQECYSTRKVNSLLRTNTTRPSKCDRTANTRGDGIAIWGEAGICVRNGKEKASCKTQNEEQGG